MARTYIMCIVALLASVSALAENPGSLIREEHKVVVDDAEELWRLEWASPPSLVCSPDQPEWVTCPCNGFAFGESGNLVLVRKRPGHEDERLALGKFFNEEFDSPGKPGEAVLRRWDVDEKDVDESDSPDFASSVQARPIAQVMRFGDYDHDGRATEFLLQVGTLPCGKRMSVVIGISRSRPSLHVFGTVEHPEKPLVLQAAHWESLLQAQAPFKIVDWACGDHGSDTETDLELSADGDGIHATKTEFACKEDGTRGRPVNKESL